MKTPVDTVKGRIVGYDERTQELLIRAQYDDWYTMTKRGYKECLVQSGAAVRHGERLV